MHYQIDAWLENGQPRLHIVDADSGHVRMAWQSQRSVFEAQRQDHSPEMKQLFRELLLLGTAEKMGIPGALSCERDQPSKTRKTHRLNQYGKK